MSVSRHFDDSGQMPFGHRGVHEEHTSFINTLLTRSYLLIKVFQMFVLYSVCSESSVV